MNSGYNTNIPYTKEQEESWNDNMEFFGESELGSATFKQSIKEEAERINSIVEQRREDMVEVERLNKMFNIYFEVEFRVRNPERRFWQPNIKRTVSVIKVRLVGIERDNGYLYYRINFPIDEGSGEDFVVQEEDIYFEAK